METLGRNVVESATENAPVFFRPAAPEDAKAAVELIYLPMGRLADHLFGDGDSSRAREVLRQMYLSGETRFSFKLCEVLEASSRVAALLLSFPAARLAELALPTGRRFQQVLGGKGMLKMLRRSVPFMRHKEANADEYYVFTLAVAREFQNAGLGKWLVERSEHLARENGLRKVSLGVTMNNFGAIRFYSRLGFSIVETVRTPSLEEAIDHPGYYKMVKKLGDGK